tara:strand:+ start:1152 stop:3638 length:2487 start_codon:yes stop_codon:yes gene_type:complete
MEISSIFTSSLTVKEIFDSVEWQTTTASIKGNDFEQKVEFPSNWSDTARNIVASKYFKTINGEPEYSLRQLITRVVSTITAWGIEHDYFMDGSKDSYGFEAELTYILLNQYACFNSPVWFNVGVPDRKQQFSACFLLDVEDNMESILTHGEDEGLVFKGGSGAGFNISKLRAKGASLSAGGTSSGPMSFNRGWDEMAGAIKSGGTTRRAARMVIMDADHPDILEFIESKVKEEQKARALVGAGFGDGIDGDAYSTVAFQNANHSVSVTNDFMYTASTNKNSGEHDTLMAIADAAWQCGDPGLVFTDQINLMNTTSQDGRIVTSNPCSEFLHQTYTSCNLASVNLRKFGTVEDFDYTAFAHVTTIITIAMDILIQGGEFPNEQIRDQTRRYRPVGIGYTNLGGILMASAIGYNSNEGREFAASVTSLMTATAYRASADMATELGAFPAWSENSGEMFGVLNRHAATKDNNWNDEWASVLSKGQTTGYRNSFVSCLAPTGTISFFMDADTTGIEPELGLMKTKSLVGGGTISSGSAVYELGLEKLGVKSVDELASVPNQNVFQTALGDNALSPEAHISMVAAVQGYLSGGVSKTVNLPSNYTVEDIFKLYVHAWEEELKTISVYRDQSKVSQPVNVQTKPVLDMSSTATNTDVPPPVVRHKLPTDVPSLRHKFKIGMLEGYITVGHYADGSPGEVFLYISQGGSTINGMADSLAIMTSFALQHGVPLATLCNKMIGMKFEPSGWTGETDITVASSLTDYIFKYLKLVYIDQANEEKADGIVEEILAKTVVEKIAAVAPSGDICTACGNADLVRTGNCQTCLTCGSSSGCG